MNEPPPNHDVTVWRWSLDPPDGVVASLAGLLSRAETERGDAFTNATAKRRFMVARGGLRRLLASQTGLPARDVRFDYGPMGKPELTGVDKRAPRFNLSHSGDLALCAIGEQPVGVDLERLRPLSDPKGMAARWYSPAEQRRIDSAPVSERLNEFFRVWTAKEAVLKLLGIGVGESLPRIETPEDPAGGVATALPPNEHSVTGCWVVPLSVDDGHYAALATLRPPRGVTIRELTL